MKKFAIILVMCFMSAISMAQAPQAFAFQSTLTDTSGMPYANDTISVQFSILMGSGTSTPVYQETHSVVTSPTGYFSANVGQGSIIGTSLFSAISWPSSSYWLKVEVDAGNGLINLGTSQLLSVPYALSAGKPHVFYATDTTTTPDTICVFNNINIDTDSAYNSGIYTIPETGIYRIVIGLGCGTPVNLIVDDVIISSITTIFDKPIMLLANAELKIGKTNSACPGTEIQIIQIK